MDESAPAFPNPAIEQRLPPPTLPPPPTLAAAAPAPAPPQMAAPTAVPPPSPAAAPTLPGPLPSANSAPAAAPFVAPIGHAPHPDDREVSFMPVVDSGSKSKRPLMLALTLITVLAAAVGAFIVSRGTSDDALTDETPQLVTDAETDTAFSFSTATTNANAAGSLQFEMSSTTPDGNMSMIAIVDRASQRASVTADMSELTVDDSFLETPDSVTMILDESTSTMYLGSEFFEFFVDTETPWVSMNADDMNVEGEGSFDEIFANPFEMTSLFGNIEPVDLGLETIEGEELRHFQVPLAVRDMLAESGAGDDFLDLRGIEGIEELDEVVYDVWIDEDNTIRRIGLDLVIAGQTNSFDMWIEMSAAGVEIPLPAPAEVTDLEELFGSWTTEFENPQPATDDAAPDFGTTIELDNDGSVIVIED